MSEFGLTTAFIKLKVPKENGHCEDFNGRLRDELPNREVFKACGKYRSTLKIVENSMAKRLCASGYRPLIPEAIIIIEHRAIKHVQYIGQARLNLSISSAVLRISVRTIV